MWIWCEVVVDFSSVLNMGLVRGADIMFVLNVGLVRGADVMFVLNV